MPHSSSDRYQRLYRAARGFRDRHPSLHAPLRALNRLARVRPPVAFSGWGMTTEHQLPWVDDHRWACFRESLQALHRLELTGESGVSAETLDGLAWRHWTIAFALDHALTVVERPAHVEVVECGVADGITAFLTLRELADHRRRGGPSFRMHLYDSWQTMQRDSLLSTEAVQAGRYARLSLDLTKRNLAEFSAAVEYHVGYIPESLGSSPEPDGEVVFVQIDLNAVTPTMEACEHFWPRLAPGGVMVFDDYGWLGFEDTKAAVDRFFADLPGSMLKMPTGQAVFLRAAR
jgi:O-methyltransferase